MSLWNFFQSKPKRWNSQRRIFKIPNYIQRASFCTCQKASYSIEAAVVIPLLAGYLATLLFFFSVIEVQCAVDEALLYAGRKAAVESCVVDSEELLFLSTEAYMLQVLKDNTYIDRLVENGVLGISLWESEFDDEYILLHAKYVIKWPILFWEIYDIELSSQSVFRKWTNVEENEDADTYVYITVGGEVYHKDLTCRSIDITVRRSTLDAISTVRGKNGQRYYECTRCCSEENNSERVYYTDYGVRYHRDLDCSALKRNVEKIKLDEAQERRPCSFCYNL